MYHPDYFLATNTAYETLLNVNFTLPVKTLTILKQFKDIRLISYSEVARRKHLSYNEIIEFFASEFGFLYRYPRDPWKAIIFYNDKKSLQTIRFTIAHELGHYVLGHLEDDDVSKKEANCYARNILCPIPIRCNLPENKVETYMETFDISEPMATTVMALTFSDLYYISDELYTEVFNKYEFYELIKILDEYLPFEAKKAL